LGKTDVAWQLTTEVLARFGRKLSAAQKNYAAFVADGVKQGKRHDLVGGGLIRSSGGWKQLQEQSRAGFKQKSDERILGDGEFVETVLAQAEEQLESQTHYHQMGITFETLAERISTLFEIEKDELLSAGKQPARVRARSLLCFWAVRKLGMTTAAVAHKVGMTQPAVSRAVERGRGLAGEVEIDPIGA